MFFIVECNLCLKNLLVYSDRDCPFKKINLLSQRFAGLHFNFMVGLLNKVHFVYPFLANLIC